MPFIANLRVIKPQKAVDFNQTFHSRLLLYVRLKELPSTATDMEGGRLS